MQNKALIETFYTAFANGNASKMIACYHDDITFTDPAFGTLNGQRAKQMWQMLLSQKSSGTKISFENISATDTNGQASWTAKYTYGDQKRQVVNHVQANFEFKDGQIIKHTDTFDLWSWSKQALGPIGYLLGWSAFMKNKVQKTTKDKLDAFIKG